MRVPPGCYSLAQQAAESHASLVQLRLRGPNCASEHLSNLCMLISFHVVQDEHGAVTTPTGFCQSLKLPAIPEKEILISVPAEKQRRIVAASVGHHNRTVSVR